MLLIKKLCRLTGESRRAAHERDQPPHNNTASGAAHNRRNCQQTTHTGIEQSLRRRFAATLDCSSGGERATGLCRTPPPLYNSLPATPPPSYSPRHTEHACNGSDEFIAALPIIQVQDLQLATTTDDALAQRASLNSEQNFHAERSDSPAVVIGGFQTLAVTGRARRKERGESNSSAELDAVTTTEATGQQHEQEQLQLQLQQQQHWQYHQQQQLRQQQQQHQAQQQRQKHNHQQLQRRRRLHLLQQQQRFAHSINVTSTDSTSSSDSELQGVHLRRRRQLRRDVYCPDLLHACSLILNQQQQTSDSSVGNFTDTPPPPLPPAVRPNGHDSSSDYAEIDELLPSEQPQRQHQHQSNPELHAPAHAHAHLYQNDLQWMSQQRALCAAATANGATNSTFTRQLNGNSPNQRFQLQEMGQHISLRRPRISLTWVLREQQQQQQQQQTLNKEQEQNASDEKLANGTAQLCESNAPNNNNAPLGTEHAEQKQKQQQRTETVPQQLDVGNTITTTTTTTTTKRYRVKQLPGSAEPLNGYATTPTAHTAHVAITAAAVPQKFFSNQNLLDYKGRARAPSKELLFVCTPQRLPKSHSGDANDNLALAKKRNEIRKKMANKMAMLQAKSRAGDGAEAPPASHVHANGLEKDELKSLKGTYSEPSLIAASEGNHQRRHRHRKRRERNRVPKFGYEIQNVDEFLTKCSLASPGNIPVVLSVASTLYQTRPGGYQMEIPLPLGMVVNAVFKNQNWLYVQTPHAEEGYVMYTCCLPLGILPPAARGSSASTKPTPCWESNGDVFPRPCGNMTDSEKEIRMRGGTRSDGARTPCGKRNNNNGLEEANTMPQNVAQYGENHLDKLYLRAASQPKLVEKAYAQLRSTKATMAALSVRSQNDEYVTLQQKTQQQQQHPQQHMHKHAITLHRHPQQQQQPQTQQIQKKATILNGAYVTNGHNGQHLHPGNLMHQMQQQQQHAQVTTLTPSLTNGNLHQSLLNAVRRPQGLRQTLVAINTDYATDSITLHKGEIVTLCECRESKDHRQWFYVKTRDGREGYIPAEVAGHGYL